MGYALYSTDEGRLQRKLIPVNILIALISLVAAISLIFTPLLTINTGVLVKELAVVMSEEQDGGSGEAVIVEENGDGSGGNGENGSDLDIAKMAEKLGEILDADANIVIKPLDMAKIMFAPAEEKGKLLTDKFFLDNGMFEKVTISTVNLLIVAASPSDSDIIDNVDLEKLNEELKKFDGVKDREEFDSKLDGFIDALQLQLGTTTTLTPEDKDSIKDELGKMYDDTVAKTDGEFTAEKMICVTLSPEEGDVYTNYGDLISGISSDPESAEGMTALLATFTSMVETAAPIYGYGFIYVLGNALVWIILFLFSFFHIFKRNKRFTMWYAKLTGCWPCIIFWGIFSTFGAKIVALVPEVANFAGVFTAFSSLTWISGICYLLMWLVSICWAFPIKHKIRKMRKGKL